MEGHRLDYDSLDPEPVDTMPPQRPRGSAAVRRRYKPNKLQLALLDSWKTGRPVRRFVDSPKMRDKLINAVRGATNKQVPNEEGYRPTGPLTAPDGTQLGVTISYEEVDDGRYAVYAKAKPRRKRER